MRTKRKLRRLIGIKTDEVSLVDIAANQRKFLIIKKQNKEENTVEELKEVLEGIEKALNTIANNQAVMSKAMAAGYEDDELDEEDEVLKSLGLVVRKAGSKYSKANRSKLRQIQASITSLLDGVEDDDDKDDKDVPTKKSESDRAKARLIAGIHKGAGTEEDEPNPTDMDGIVKALIPNLIPAIAKALKMELPEDK